MGTMAIGAKAQANTVNFLAFTSAHPLSHVKFNDNDYYSPQIISNFCHVR
jgi:hypothetical protein